MYGPIPFGHGLANVFGAIVGFLGSLILFAVVVTVLFFLIRFLIIGTKAAQLYLDTDWTAVTAPPAVGPAESGAADPSTPSSGAPAAPSPTPARPAPKPRSSKTPPNSDL
ncbi:hypothetical protein BH10ACT6_BH10ACT6_11710 [soil metagenome]